MNDQIIRMTVIFVLWVFLGKAAGIVTGVLQSANRRILSSGDDLVSQFQTGAFKPRSQKYLESSDDGQVSNYSCTFKNRSLIHNDLDDFIRDLELFTKASEHLFFGLEERDLVTLYPNISVYSTGENSLLSCFSEQYNLVYRSHISVLMTVMRFKNNDSNE